MALICATGPLCLSDCLSDWLTTPCLTVVDPQKESLWWHWYVPLDHCCSPCQVTPLLPILMIYALSLTRWHWHCCNGIDMCYVLYVCYVPHDINCSLCQCVKYCRSTTRGTIVQCWDIDMQVTPLPLTPNIYPHLAFVNNCSCSCLTPNLR